MSPSPDRTANLRGAALMVASMAGFTLNDGAVKLVLQRLPLGEVMFLRGVLISAVLLGLALSQRRLFAPLSLRDRMLVAVRVVGEVGSTILYLQALRRIPIADLSAILQSLPLMVTCGAAIVFGERIGARRLAAILVGLGGVLLILRPGTPNFDVWSLVALGSVGLIVVRDLATRAMSAAVPTSTVALSAAVAVSLSGAALGVSEAWLRPTAPEALLLVLAAALLTVGYVAAVSAMRVGEIGFTAPFRYASLLIAIALGVVVFGEWPDAPTWAGAAVVVAAGLVVLAPERVRSGA